MTNESSDLSPLEELNEKKKHLLELQDFILKSPIYRGFLTARTYEIALMEQTIIEFEPVERKDEIEAIKMRGDLRTLKTFLTVFEDARTNLKTRIEELETELESKTQQSK